MTQLRSKRPTVDQVRLDATTPDEIRRHAIEDGQNPDAPAAQFELVFPVREVRRKLGMSQANFAATLHIPIGTIRNWEQERVRPDPAAQALLTILYRQPRAALEALRAA